MSGKFGIAFQGHIVDHFENGFVIYSKHFDNNTPVFGPDVDFTCLVASGLHYLKVKNLSIHTDIEGIDTDVISSMGFNFTSSPQQADYIINTTMDACVSFSPSGETFQPSTPGPQANTELLNEIQQAWEKELASVSQGAFVSREQYIRSLDQRINLKAQKKIIPPFGR